MTEPVHDNSAAVSANICPAGTVRHAQNLVMRLTGSLQLSTAQTTAHQDQLLSHMISCYFNPHIHYANSYSKSTHVTNAAAS